MKEYCVDLELAKELKENGFLQLSKFYWNELYPSSGIKKDGNLKWEICFRVKPKLDDISAPLAEELLVQLPSELTLFKFYGNKEVPYNYRLNIEKNLKNYIIGYVDINTGEWEVIFKDKKLSNVCAKMYICLNYFHKLRLKTLEKLVEQAQKLKMGY